MGWDCDICHNGHESDHGLCRIVKSLDSIDAQLTELTKAVEKLTKKLK